MRGQKSLLISILSEVKRSGYDGLTPAGVVLTGGVAQLPGLSDLSTARMRWPVRIGQPNGAVALDFRSDQS